MDYIFFSALFILSPVVTVLFNHWIRGYFQKDGELKAMSSNIGLIVNDLKKQNDAIEEIKLQYATQLEEYKSNNILKQIEHTENVKRKNEVVDKFLVSLIDLKENILHRYAIIENIKHFNEFTNEIKSKTDEFNILKVQIQIYSSKELKDSILILSGYLFKLNLLLINEALKDISSDSLYKEFVEKLKGAMQSKSIENFNFETASKEMNEYFELNANINNSVLNIISIIQKEFYSI